MPLVVLVVALGFRLFRLAEAWEVHIDEASYAEVSRSVASGSGLRLSGGPFHLHPPGVFLLMAAVIRVAGLESEKLALIQQLRPVEAVIGSVTCLLVAVLVRRLAGALVGLLAGLSLAVDPFTNRWDSRLFLEAPAMAWCVVAVLLLTVVAGGEAPRTRWVVATGLAIGAAVLSKEPYVMASAVPVLVLLVTGWTLSRRRAAVVLLVSAGCWSAYVLTMVVTGSFGDWEREKLSGVRRLVGVQQETGFNAAGHESLSGQLLQNVVGFGPSYALVALGTAGAAVILLSARPWRRRAASRSTSAGLRDARVVVAVWQLSAVSYLAYAVLFGTLEEQTFCLVLTPSVVTAGTAVSVLRSRATRWRELPVVALVGLVVLQTVSTAGLRLQTDDGYRSLDSWVRSAVPDGSVVGATEDTGQFLLQGVVINTRGDLAGVVAEDDDLVVVSTALVARGFGTLSSETLFELDRDARLVYCVSGRTLGELRVYDVRGITGGSGAAAGAQWPEVTGGRCA